MKTSTSSSESDQDHDSKGDMPKESPKSDNPTSNKSSQEDDIKLDEETMKIYPQRRANDDKFSLTKTLFNTEAISKNKCERKIVSVIENSPMLKLMVSALRKGGCELDYSRHISAELCGPEVSGGYDPQLNQIVICHNRISSKNAIRSILSHEMIHMFDFCRAKFDFKNIEHITCSEIRAANLAHCSFLSALSQGSTSIFDFKRTHRNCVKAKALVSVMLTHRDLTKEKAWEVMDKVFDRCYDDLEPVGRRIRRGSDHMEWAYRERFHYNYD